MDKIIQTFSNTLDQYQMYENYEQIIEKCIIECNNRLKVIKNNKSDLILKNIVKKFPLIIKFFNININHDVRLVDKEYQQADYNVYSYLKFKIGPMIITRSFSGDDEGFGYIHVTVNNITLSEQFDENDVNSVDDESFNELIEEMVDNDCK